MAIYPSNTDTSGGGGGGSFNDSHVIELWGPIRQIVIRHGEFVDAIGTLFENGIFRNHGGSGGYETVINLARDEYVC